MSSLQGDQPHSGQRMRGAEGSPLLSRAGLRSITMEVLSAILDIMKHMSVRIDLMNPADWPEVCSIYEEGIATGLGTFETKVPSWEEWNAARLPHSRLVARNERVLGWAALSPVSKRACYAGVAEVGIYITASARGRGIGRALLQALIESSETNGIWTLQGATIAENTASLTLQERCGFRVIGRRERISKVAGVWHDTVLTERRSKKVGIE
ncbi:MAG: N-acetyltransferase family protein [Terriglobales bacterium]